jgi:hypothetical protein
MHLRDCSRAATLVVGARTLMIQIAVTNRDFMSTRPSHASDYYGSRPQRLWMRTKLFEGLDSFARRPRSRINCRAVDSMISFGNTVQYLSMTQRRFNGEGGRKSVG